MKIVRKREKIRNKIKVEYRERDNYITYSMIYFIILFFVRIYPHILGILL